jgi:hypothetical protein
VSPGRCSAIVRAAAQSLRAYFGVEGPLEYLLVKARTRTADPLLTFVATPERQERSGSGLSRPRPEFTVAATLRSPRGQRHLDIDDRQVLQT